MSTPETARLTAENRPDPCRDCYPDCNLCPRCDCCCICDDCPERRSNEDDH